MSSGPWMEIHNIIIAVLSACMIEVKRIYIASESINPYLTTYYNYLQLVLCIISEIRFNQFDMIYHIGKYKTLCIKLLCY